MTVGHLRRDLSRPRPRQRPALSQPGRGDSRPDRRHHGPEQEPRARWLADRGGPLPRLEARRTSGGRGGHDRERDLVGAGTAGPARRGLGTDRAGVSAGARPAEPGAPRPRGARRSRRVPRGRRRAPKPTGRLLSLSGSRAGHRELLRSSRGIESGPGLATALLEGTRHRDASGLRVRGTRGRPCGSGWRPAGCTAPRGSSRRRPWPATIRRPCRGWWTSSASSVRASRGWCREPPLRDPRACRGAGVPPGRSGSHHLLPERGEGKLLKHSGLGPVVGADPPRITRVGVGAGSRSWGWPGLGGGRNSGLPSSGLSRTSQGVWWMRRWWWPQSRTRLASLVLPPCSQCTMWWAWHITGGRVQPGKAQCWSRQTRARHRGAVTRRWVRPTSRTSLRVPSATGMMSASQASRRTTPGVRVRPSSVTGIAPSRVSQSIRPSPAQHPSAPAPPAAAPVARGGGGGEAEAVAEGVEVGGDGDPGSGAVGVGGQVGGQGVRRRWRSGRPRGGRRGRGGRRPPRRCRGPGPGPGR